MACAAAAYTAQCTWPGHAGGGDESAQQAKQRTCSSARAARGEGAGSRVDRVPSRLVVSSPAERRVGQSSGEERNGRWGGLAQASTGGCEELRACRGVGGDPPGPWPARRYARIAQGSRVGELQPRIVPLSRRRLVSRFGQKNLKSATCEPGTLRRSALPRPPSRQRSARTSPPRRRRRRRGWNRDWNRHWNQKRRRRRCVLL